MNQSIKLEIFKVVFYMVLYIFLLLAVILFWSSYPKVLASWSQKGTLYDLIGPAILLAGTFASIGLARHRRLRREAGSWRWLGYATLLWILAMEEMGWGFEALGLARLEVAGIPVDSAHDVARLARRLGISSLTMLLKAGAVVLALGCAGLLLTASGRRLIRLANPGVVTLLVLGGLTLFFAAILDARVVDVFGFLRRNPPYALEESLELLGEIMLALVVVDGWIGLAAVRVGRLNRRPPGSPPTATAAAAAVSASSTTAASAVSSDR